MSERGRSEIGRRLIGTLTHGLRRQRRHALPAMLLAIGLAPPVALAAGVPLYAEATSVRLLSEQLQPDEQDLDGGSVDLSYLFSFNRLSGGSKNWSEIAPLDQRFYDQSLDPLPVVTTERFIETNPFSLGRETADGGEILGSVTVAAATDAFELADLVSGELPEPAEVDRPIEVLVEQVFAEDEGLTPGTAIVLVDRSDQRFAAVVSGIWTDGSAKSVFGEAAAFRKRLLVPAETITDVLSPSVDEAIQNVRWRLDLDAARIRSGTVSEILAASERLEANASSLVSGVRLLVNPDGPLRAFRDDQDALERGLAGFSLPLLVLAVAVGVLLSTITMRSRHAEFKMLRRRGEPRWHLFGGVVAESVIVTAAAVVIGTLGAFGVAHVIGRTSTFFRFSSAEGLDVALSGIDLTALAGATAVVLAMQLAPAVVAVWRSDGERTSGDDRRPWWQRTYLDLAAILVIALLTVRGVRADTGRAALLDDPAVVLLPSAAALAGALVVLRLMPLVMRLAAAALARTEMTAALVAARRAARVPGDIAAPLLLLVITASMATFTASLAVTLDLQLLDGAHHTVGAEARVVDRGIETPARANAPADDAAIPAPERTTVRHAALDAYQDVWGVERASPMIEVVGTGDTPAARLPGLLFVGVDPASFADIAFWRDDYASRPLDELMAQLRGDPTAVLASSELMRSGATQVGDTLSLVLNTAGVGLALEVTIVGEFEQFPRWFPDQESPLVVGRADAIEALTDSTNARTVLLEPGVRFADRTRVENDFAGIGGNVGPVASVDRLISSAQQEPGRQGVLGLLTIGVALATLLTLGGFVVSTITSFRRRTTQMGVLRAMGMSRREVTTLALFDLGTVMVLGLVVAIGFGLALSRWFIPVLVDTPPGAAPDLLPAIAWSAAATIGISLAALLAASGMIVATTLRRVRLYEAIRMGEP